MKKLAKISAVLFTMVFGLMLMFHEACETLDQQFIAPSVASNLEKHDFKIVDQKYCSAIASNPRARYACELFKADSIDSHRIRQVVGDGYQFKKLLLMKDYIPEESGESDLFWPISLFASNSYDAYSMEYSSEYREDWDYSVFNLVEISGSSAPDLQLRYLPPVTARTMW